MPDAPTTPETGTPAEATPPAATPPATGGGKPTPEPSGTSEPIKLPDDHPLVKAYADTKAKLRKREDAERSETERLTDDLSGATERAAKAEARAARLEAAVKYGLSGEDLDLLGDGTPDEIDDRAKRLSERIGASKAKNNHVAREGGNPPSADPNDERATARALFGG